MADLKIIRLGNPILRKRSTSVTKKELRTKRFQKFLNELSRICVENKGAGIAAPQAGLNKRAIVVYVDPKNPRYPNRKLFPLTIVINPKVVLRSKEIKEDWEGDLSVDLRGLVPRSVGCVVKGFDRFGKGVEFNLKNDFHARVFQHEIDHLDGVMFLDRIKNKKSICEEKEWKKFWKKK